MKDHKLKRYKETCGKVFDGVPTTSDILEHFEECAGVTKCNDLVLGDEVR